MRPGTFGRLEARPAVAPGVPPTARRRFATEVSGYAVDMTRVMTVVDGLELDVPLERTAHRSAADPSWIREVAQ